MLNFSNGVYRNSVSIDAHPQIVWKALTDTVQYPKWNTFTPGLQCNWQIGSRILLKVKLSSWIPTFTESNKLIELQNGKKIIWGMSFGNWLITRRVQTLLHAEETRSTVYHNQSEIRGYLGPLVLLLTGSTVSKRFNEMAIDLKKYCER